MNSDNAHNQKIQIVSLQGKMVAARNVSLLCSTVSHFSDAYLSRILINATPVLALKTLARRISLRIFSKTKKIIIIPLMDATFSETEPLNVFNAITSFM